jgi:hypothetical protein
MDDAPAVGVCERRGDLHAVAENRLDGEPGVANQLGQRLPLDDLHRDVQASPASTTSYTVQMLGWLRADEALASCRR